MNMYLLRTFLICKLHSRKTSEVLIHKFETGLSGFILLSTGRMTSCNGLIEQTLTLQEILGRSNAGQYTVRHFAVAKLASTCQTTTLPSSKCDQKYEPGKP